MKNVLVVNTATLVETMKVLDESAKQFVAVVNNKEELVGTITDCEIRRAI